MRLMGVSMSGFTHLNQDILRMFDDAVDIQSARMPLVNGRRIRMAVSDIISSIYDVINFHKGFLEDDESATREFILEVVMWQNMKFLSQYQDDAEYLAEVSNDLAWILGSDLGVDQRRRVEVVAASVRDGLSGNKAMYEVIKALRFDGIHALTCFDQADERRLLLTEMLMLDTFISMSGQLHYETLRKYISERRKDVAEPGLEATDSSGCSVRPSTKNATRLV